MLLSLPLCVCAQVLLYALKDNGGSLWRYMSQHPNSHELSSQIIATANEAGERAREVYSGCTWDALGLQSLCHSCSLFFVVT